MAKVYVDSIIYDDSGDTEVTVATLANPDTKLVKIHQFEYNTRTAASSSANVNAFTWTQSFTPVDRANLFHVHASVPANTVGQDFSGYGLRIGSVDFQGYGSMYVDQNQAYMAFQSYRFNIGSNVLSTGTLAVHHRYYTASSHVIICPNSSDQVRLSAQTRAFLTIIEYKA
jgi:hypothetical protein